MKIKIHTRIFQPFSVEGIFSPRPLSPLTSDPEDISPLTPGHFLIGRALTFLREANFTEMPENRLDNFQKLKEVVQYYWSRWQKEYTVELPTRTQWPQRSQVVLTVRVLVLDQGGNISFCQDLGYTFNPSQNDPKDHSRCCYFWCVVILDELASYVKKTVNML